MPKVSIIIPAYNVAHWVGETLRSVEQQTFTDFECIIIDDASTDETCLKIKEFVQKDSRFQLIQKKANQGQGAARNEGMELAQGEYIAFLDSDDIWSPIFLEQLLELIQRNNTWLAYSRYAMFYDGSNIRKPEVWINLLCSGNIWWDMLQMAEFHMCSWLGRTSIVRAVGNFDSSMRIAQDRDFLLRLLAHICRQHPEKICGTEKELFFYRQRKNSTVHTRGREVVNIEWHFMSRYLDDPDIPPKVRRRGYSLLAFKMAVISLNIKEFHQALSWFVKAVLYDPLNINLYWIPLRKLWLICKRREYVDLKFQKFNTSKE